MAPRRNTGAGAEADLPEYAGHYRLESCLGAGGMGVVHLARSTSGRQLAVKVVHAEFARDPEFRGRFRQEVAAARRVSGAFTASVVDADPEAERPWMATLFIPGPTLSDHVKRNGPMAPAQVRRLMAGLAEALRDIHRVGVVHRDLKPSNVLLAEDGPKVIDFGISRPADSELRTETGKLIGTPPFMAPEQFRRPREVGPAADIFALGSVLVHAATGRGPFDSDSPYVVAYQVVHDDPDLTGVPDDLASLVERCLAKEPEDRPTPDELMRELRSVSASYDTQAFIPAQRTDEPGAGAAAARTDEAEGVEPAADAPGARPAGRRLRRRLGVAAGVFGLLAGGGLASMAWSDQAGGGNGTARTTGSPATAAAFRAWAVKPVTGSGGAPECSAGAGRLLCARPGVVFAVDPSDGSLLWRRAVATTRWSGPPVLAGGLVQPPSDHGRSLQALDPATGKPAWQRTFSAYSGVLRAGDTLVLTGTDGTATGVDAATGRTKWHRRVPGQGTAGFTAFAGDDDHAYTTTVSADGSTTRVVAVDADTGAVAWDARLKGTLRPVAAQDGSVFFLSLSSTYGYADAVVRYRPGSAATRRVALPVPREDPQATVAGHVVHVLGAAGSLDAIDMDSGKRMWHLETSVSRGSLPVADAEHVYVSAADGRLLAVDARSGRLVGQTPARIGGAADRVPAVLPEPVVLGRRVCATAPDGTVFTVDGRDPAGW
ncbi:serine/threonine-protein kinase [Streptomyces mangrovisoli]|uniref:Serine/threonine protein kinase n=1 Tax=Streptomyces mangrovisoli TaxID=1428628 RepID=A0A1J4P3K5_9ACTN|nr:serine/threonine-protein kinase [Streptomyces mangrovisoli]OIJ69179.1 serine/threonine protein kinase [Streptomyces mangrovisoli]